MINKKQEIKRIAETLEKLTGKKVIYEAKDSEGDESKDSKDSKKEDKKEDKKDSKPSFAPKTKEVNVDSAAGGIIAPNSIAVIQTFMDETLQKVEDGINELRAVKIAADTTASSEDFYSKAQAIQDNVKQLARMATYVSNTVKAQKFDKGLMDRIVTYKNNG